VEAPAPGGDTSVVLIFLWALPILSRGIKTQMQLDSRIATQLFLGVVCSAITLFFIITYGFGRSNLCAGITSSTSCNRSGGTGLALLEHLLSQDSEKLHFLSKQLGNQLWC